MNKHELIDVNRKLTIEEQKHYLGDFLGFELDEYGIIYDEDGEEFYSNNDNMQHELETLKGILKYYAFVQSEYKLMNFKRQVKSLFD